MKEYIKNIAPIFIVLAVLLTLLGMFVFAVYQENQITDPAWAYNQSSTWMNKLSIKYDSGNYLCVARGNSHAKCTVRTTKNIIALECNKDSGECNIVTVINE